MRELKDGANGGEDDYGRDPEGCRENDVVSPVAECWAARAEKLAQRCFAHADAPDDERGENPFPCKRGEVLPNMMLAEGLVRGFEGAE